MIELINALAGNAALFLIVVVLYDALGFRRNRESSIPRQLLAGALLGLVGIAVMADAFTILPGLVFDTRSVVLSLGALFFGSIPALLAVLVTGAFRLSLGGPGTAMGVTVIFLSAAIGLAWRKMRRRPLESLSLAEFYVLGLTVHLAMLACTLFLPQSLRISTLKSIAIPVMLIYPVATALGGGILRSGRRRRLEREARVALAESENRFRLAFDTSPDSITISRLSDGVFLNVNQGISDITGYRTEDIIGKSSLELNIWVRPEDRQALRAELEARKIVRNFEAPFRTRDGSIRSGLMSAAIITVDGEKCILSITHDITQRVAQERKLSELRRRLTSHIDNTPLAAIEWDLDFRVTAWNPGAEKIFGYSREEAIGCKGTELLIPETSRPLLDELWKKLLKEQVAAQSCNENLRKDGEIIVCDWFNTPLIDEEGRLIGIASLAQDISERITTQEDLKRLNTELESRVRERTRELEERVAEARNLNHAMLNLLEDQQTQRERMEEIAHTLENTNRELNSFAYSVSHDLRAPLRAIDGFGEALEEELGSRLEPAERDYLDRIRKAAQRMGEMIDGLLLLSRAGRTSLEASEVDLSALARGLVEEFIAAEPKRKIEIEIAENLTTVGDKVLLRQLLQNLLDNAWKFSSKSEPARIEFGRIEGAKSSSGEPEFFVRDNGTGFDMEHAEKLFGVFQRLHPEKDFPGTGIGLATAQRIVLRHGGKIRAEAEPGEGATFYFTFNEGRKE